MNNLKNDDIYKITEISKNLSESLNQTLEMIKPIAETLSEISKVISSSMTKLADAIDKAF